MTERRREVATLEELQSGPKLVTIESKKYLICKVEDRVYGYRNICPHQYGPALEGKIEDDRFICPWHGREFSLDGGDSPFDDHIDRCVPQVEVVVEDGVVYTVV